jgi:hypothetical protein
MEEGEGPVDHVGDLWTQIGGGRIAEQVEDR